jgi:hypothetical protein
MCQASASAQVPDPHAAQPERPSVATHAGTVAAGWLEVEAGLALTRRDGRLGDAGVPIAGKLGLADRLQLTVSPTVSRSGDGRWAFGDLGLSLKWRIGDDWPIVGSLAVLPGVTWGEPADAPARSRPTTAGVVVISSRSIGDLSLDVNAGYTHRIDDLSGGAAETLWAIALGGPIAGRVGWGAEIYGYPRTRGPSARPGIVGSVANVTVAVRPALAIDVGVVAGLSRAEEHAIVAGVVWNAGRAWKASLP